MEPITVTADDYGLDPAVNRGIEALAAARCVDGVSVMAHADAEWGTLPRLLASGVRVGAHLVLVEERPLTGGPRLSRLLERGRLPRTYQALFARVLARPWLAAALADEAAAQLDRLRRAGVPLAFVNSHQHVHLFPPLWRALRDLLDREGWHVRAVRAPVLAGPAKQLAVELAAAASWAVAPLRRARAVRPLGIESAGRLTPERAAAAARRAGTAAPGPAELVAHPGERAASLDERYGHWHYAWEEELAALRTGAIRRALDGAGVEEGS